MITAANALIYVWQMNDGRWHVSALGIGPVATQSDTELLLSREGFDTGFDRREDLVSALRKKGFRA